MQDRGARTSQLIQLALAAPDTFGVTVKALLVDPRNDALLHDTLAALYDRRCTDRVTAETPLRDACRIEAEKCRRIDLQDALPVLFARAVPCSDQLLETVVALSMPQWESYLASCPPLPAGVFARVARVAHSHDLDIHRALLGHDGSYPPSVIAGAARLAAAYMTDDAIAALPPAVAAATRAITDPPAGRCGMFARRYPGGDLDAHVGMGVLVHLVRDTNEQDPRLADQPAAAVRLAAWHVEHGYDVDHGMLCMTGVVPKLDAVAYPESDTVFAFYQALVGRQPVTFDVDSVGPMSRHCPWWPDIEQRIAAAASRLRLADEAGRLARAQFLQHLPVILARQNGCISHLPASLADSVVRTTSQAGAALAVACMCRAYDAAPSLDAYRRLYDTCRLLHAKHTLGVVLRAAIELACSCQAFQVAHLFVSRTPSVRTDPLYAKLYALVEAWDKTPQRSGLRALVLQTSSAATTAPRAAQLFAHVLAVTLPSLHLTLPDSRDIDASVSTWLQAVAARLK